MMNQVPEDQSGEDLNEFNDQSSLSPQHDNRVGKNVPKIELSSVTMTTEP